MAVTVSNVYQATDVSVWNVISDADGDLTATITHGIGAAPEEVLLVPMNVANFFTSLWRVTTIDATQVIVTKTGAVGSGNAAVQLRVVCRRNSHRL